MMYWLLPARVPCVQPGRYIYSEERSELSLPIGIIPRARTIHNGFGLELSYMRDPLTLVSRLDVNMAYLSKK